jgi:alpha-L-fucosidase
MKNLFYLILIASSTPLLSTHAAPSKRITPAEARALFEKMPATETTTPYHPNTNPGAQWFPEAGFGLFIHWGIHSIKGLSPSWCLYNNRFGPRIPADISLTDYYALAKEFDPQKYNPDLWMKMAKSIGMRYVVITTKHHDGFCLWPSEYGDYNTKSGANGRDLLKEYVEAARKNGLKVGFYFSPRDWGYNHHKSGFNVAAKGFESDNPPKLPFPEEKNREEYLKWIDYTVGQLSELLTQYGPIDVLWFDGDTWIGNVPKNEYGNKIRNWVYALQPQILINPRWGSVVNPNYTQNASPSIKKIERSSGDFYTFESKWDDIVNPEHNEGVKEPIWFEFCDIWKGWGWGYQKAANNQPDPKRMRRTLERLATLRAFGGNYLLNIGPSPDGEVRPDILAEAKQLSPWIATRKEAFWNTQPVKNWPDLCAYPITRKENTLYIHLMNEKGIQPSSIQLAVKQLPQKAYLLGDPTKKIDVSKKEGVLQLKLPEEELNPLGEIIKLEFNSQPIQ